MKYLYFTWGGEALQTSAPPTEVDLDNVNKSGRLVRIFRVGSSGRFQEVDVWGNWWFIDELEESEYYKKYRASKKFEEDQNIAEKKKPLKEKFKKEEGL